jgi:hypothetical protein
VKTRSESSYELALSISSSWCLRWLLRASSALWGKSIVRRLAFFGSEKTSLPGLSIRAGTWLDPYTGQTLTDSSEIDIDHVVALANAWRSGANSAEWSAADREAYANEPEALLSTDAGTNRTKGDKGPEAWKPPNHDYWCEYARRWIWIKSDWHLTVNPAEKSSLQQMLGTCGAG